MATLREAKTLTLTPTADAEALYSPQNLAADRAGQIAGATQFGRGWESAGLGEQANSLWTDSVKARLEGDTQSADVLALQAQDLQQQAAEWAPTVKNFTDVKGLRSGLDWAGGALGNLRTSVAPALGGLAGATAGAALAPLTGGVVNPATVGFAGAALAGYNSEMNEAVANAVNDPDIAAARTPEEIIRVGRLKGLGNSMLEALVPAMLGGKLVGQGAKRAVGAGVKGAAARISQEAAIGGVGEFATETAQSLGGRTAQNYLGSRPLTDYDYQQAFNEGMSGLVGGGVMGGMGGVADVMYDRLGQGVDKAKEIKADPAQAAADMLAGAGKLGGTMAGKAAPVATKFVDWVTGSKNRTYDDLTNPSVPDEVVEPYAHEWATNVLATQNEHSADDVRAAAEYIRDIAKPGALSIYRLKIEANRNEGRLAGMDASIADEIEKRVRGKTKSSKMRGTLVDDFGEQEGRDQSEDVLMDDFGNQTSGAVAPHGYQGRTFGDIGYEVPATAPTGAQVSYGQDLARRAPPQWPATPEPAAKTPGEMRATYEATKRTDKPVSTEQTADIWRKQGVSEGLLSATTPITDEAQRRMAIAAMGWVERGFKDVDGNVFVPESLIKQQGKNVGTFIKSAVSTAFKNGLIGHDVASQASTIVEMAEKQHAEATAVFDTVKGAIPEYARKKYSRSDVQEQIIPMLRHVAKYGLSSDKAEAGRQEAALLEIFGTKEALAQAMSKFETPRGKNMLAQENDAEDVFDANELGKRAPGKTSDDEADARYESELATSAGETRYVGVDKDNTPFDTRDSKQFDKLTALAGDVSSGRVSRVVGLWQRIKDSSQSEGDLREAEGDLLLEHAKDFLQPSRLADIERYGVSMQEVVDTMPELQRRSILRKIDNRYKMIRLDNMGDAAAADAIPKGRTTEMIREAPKTIDQGGLFLEREAGGKVMKTPFATTAIRLIKHFLKSSEWDTISGSGLHGSYQAMLKSLAAVMETEVAHTEAVQAWYDDVRKDPDATPEVVEKAKAALDRAKAGGRFTGRIGYKTDLDGPVTWLPKGVGSRVPTKGDAAAQLATLPEVFKLGLKGSVDTGEGTLADAKKVATGALYSGDKGGALVPFETTFEGQVRALEELAARPTTSESFQWVIYNTLDRDPEQSERSWKKGIASFYQKLRGWEDGEDNLFSAVSDLYAAPDVKAPKRGSLVDSEGAAGLLEWLLRTVPEGNKLDAKRAAADQTVVSTPEGKMPPARKVKIPDVIQEKIAAHTKAGRHSKALALREEWTKTFRDVAAWQIQNTEGRGSDSDTISVGDLTSDESALSMSRAEDPSMEDMTRPTTPFAPTYPVKWRKLLEMKDAEGVELTEDEVATLAELRRGAPAWNKSFNKLFETDPRKLTDSERKLVARLQGGTSAWRAKYGVPTRPKGTIERDDEGMALGLGDDAVGAGYGGGRSTNTGTEPVVFRRKGDKIVDQRTGTQFDAASNEPAGAPLATAETPGRATTRIDPIEEVQDWAFDKLRQGLAAFVSSINSLSKERLEVLKLGVVALAKMRPDAVVKYMDRALTEQQVSTILSRAAKAARMMGATLDEGGADGQTVRVVGSGRGTSGVAGAGTQAGAGDAVLEGSKPSARGEDGGGEGPVPTRNGAAGAQGKGVTVSESASPGYRERTKHNADSADVTIAFAADYRTAGERLTATVAGSKYVRFEGSITDFVKAIVTKLRDVNGSTLNVAGNGIYTWTKHGKTQAQVNKAMHDVLRLVNKYAPLTKIVTGGQTGSDIAGAIAAKALGIPVEVTMPQGFLQRGADGTDFRQSREDVLNQIDDGAAQLKDVAEGKSESSAPTTLTAKITKQLADAKTTVDKKNVIFDELTTLLDNHTERGAFGVRLTNLKDDVKDVASYLEAMSTAEMSLHDKLTPAQAKALTEMLTKAYRAFQMAHGKSVVDVLEESKQSTQTANRGPGRELYTEEEIAKAKTFITDRLGDSVKVAFVPYFGDNSSGSWTPTNTKSVIRLALNGDIFGAAAHESMHEFFALLGKAGSKQTQDILLRTATNKVLLRKVERLLDGNPEAVKQINADPEEALAFMYQFWSAGLLKLGPETRTFFQKVKDYVAKVLGRLSKEMQDEVFVDKVFRAFDAGVLSKDGPYTKPALTDGTKRTGPEVMDGSIRDAMLRAFEQNSEAHEQALDAIDKKWRNVTRNVGKLGFSAEAMMLATGNKQIADIMSRFNQETGTAMRTVGGKVSQPYFQGVTQHNGVFMNRLSNILTAYSSEDIELARKAMATGRVATDRVAKEITEKIYALNDDLFDYITSRKVMRLDDMAHNWVPVEKRKNYFPQVWNTDAVRDKPQDVIALLLKHNMKELTAIAANANAEVAAKRKMPIGTVSRARLADESTHTITETEIAEAIVARLLQAGGYVDHDETTSDLGISPVATSVNRRSLDFVRHPDFDEFKNHDMTSIMTSYVASMVKRAEYTKHFGPGGETLRDKFDAAVLEEIGGDKLVRAALKEHGKMLADYLSRQQDAVAANERFRERRPSLRVIGLELHTKEVGKDKVEVAHQKAVKDLEQAAKAIMAMEGTLGSDISPATRQVVSAITAYQTVRLLPTVLFSSINDVMGIVARGGELGDAWKALVRGMREVRLRWKDEKSTDSAAMRAEEWGTVEAGSQMEVLGQIYGSMYMTGAARRLSNSFFKWNGMEGWNRAMRIEASVIAERALTALAKHGYNKDDPAAVARVEALYGKGFDTANIKLDGNGRLDSSDEANQAAMMHWVQSAIMTPNASHRTIWGSDPRMAPFWHLKQFAYTFHRVMLKGAFEQAKLGNYRPATVLALGYAPVTIAAGAVKEMLIPGDEPPWMKGGLDDYLSYGVSRAGIFGIPGMTYSSISDDYGVNMLGPTVSQVVNATTDAPVETGLRALPLGTLLGRAAPAQ